MSAQPPPLAAHVTSDLLDGVGSEIRETAVLEVAPEQFHGIQLGRVAAATRYVEKARKYFGLKFSEATFAGAIFQVAYTGIRLFSRQNSVPSSYKNLVESDKKKLVVSAIPFCVGQERHGVPVGLIVYAARNQYNHWDEEKPHDVTQNVFRALSEAFSENVWSDLAFELSNPTINVCANEVLLIALGWTTYDKYFAEMKALLGSPAASG